MERLFGSGFGRKAARSQQAPPPVHQYPPQPYYPESTFPAGPLRGHPEYALQPAPQSYTQYPGHPGVTMDPPRHHSASRTPEGVTVEMSHHAPRPSAPDLEDGRHQDQHGEGPSAPPLYQEKSWSSQQATRSLDNLPASTSRQQNDVQWAVANGQPLGQLTPSREPRSSWRDVYLVPKGEPSHQPWWTLAFATLAVLLFTYMAGQHALYIQSLPAQYKPSASNNPGWAADIAAQAKWGPKSLQRWVNFWGRGSGSAYTFDANYVLAWGGRYNPKLKDGQWWRWFTSIAIHGSVSHLVSNMVLFVILSMGLERQYGFIRILLVFTISGLGGNFTSALLERSCRVVVGASGAVFGLLGLYCADILLNCSRISQPLLRLIVMVACIAFVFVADNLQTSAMQVSHFTHLGGFICGLFPSLLFLPSSRDSRWKAARSLATAALRRSRILPPSEQQPPRPAISRVVRCIYHPVTWYTLMAIGVAVVVLVFAGIPVILYNSRFPGLTCPPLFQ